MTVDVLKNKIIQEVNHFLLKSKKGVYLDYSFILDEISLVELYSESDNNLNFALNYFINTEWQKNPF